MRCATLCGMRAIIPDNLAAIQAEIDTSHAWETIPLIGPCGTGRAASSPKCKALRATCRRDLAVIRGCNFERRAAPLQPYDGPIETLPLILRIAPIKPLDEALRRCRALIHRYHGARSRTFFGAARPMQVEQREYFPGLSTRNTGVARPENGWQRLSHRSAFATARLK